MSSIIPTEEQFNRFMAHEPDGPIIMLNLLRFHEVAAYEKNSDEPERSGQDAYAVYSITAQKKVESVGGTIEVATPAFGTMIGPDDEEWDVMALVRYPNRKAFMTMTLDPEYLAAVHHRTAALADSRLIPLNPWK